MTEADLHSVVGVGVGESRGVLEELHLRVGECVHLVVFIVGTRLCEDRLDA